MSDVDGGRCNTKPTRRTSGTIQNMVIAMRLAGLSDLTHYRAVAKKHSMQTAGDPCFGRPRRIRSHCKDGVVRAHFHAIGVNEIVLRVPTGDAATVLAILDNHARLVAHLA